MAPSVAVAAIFALWIVGIVLLGVIWLVTVPRGAPITSGPVPWGPDSFPGDRMTCGRCHKPLSPAWRGKCKHCGASFAEYNPVARDPKG